MNKSIIVAMSILISLISFSSNAAVSEKELEKEINTYIEGLNSEDSAVVKKTANAITASGLLDERLYDHIEKRLLKYHQEYVNGRTDEVTLRTTVELVRALGASGKGKYYPTFDRLLRENKARLIRNRAKRAKQTLSWYQRRNEEMHNLDSHQAGQSLFSTRILNLINHSDKTLNRYAMEELYRIGKAETVVLDNVSKKFKEEVYLDAGKLHIDVMAWHCKVLGKLGEEKHREQVKKAIDDKNIVSKIRRHCKKSLKKK